MYLLISYNIIYYYRAYLFLQIKIGEGRAGYENSVTKKHVW